MEDMKDIPFRNAMKDIIAGTRTGRRPTTSSRTPPTISAVTIVASVVVAGSIFTPFKRKY